MCEEKEKVWLHPFSSKGNIWTDKTHRRLPLSQPIARCESDQNRLHQNNIKETFFFSIKNRACGPKFDSTRLGSKLRSFSRSRDRIRASWFNYSGFRSGCFIRIFAESRSSHLFTYPRSYRVISDRCNCTRDACAPAVDLSRDVSLRVTTSPSSPD